MKLYRVCSLAVCAALSSPLLAQQGPPQGGPGGGQPRVFLLAIDTDRDGQLSADEIAASTKNLLIALDKNHDGQITPDEYNPHVAQPDNAATAELLQRLMLLDKNQDGVLTADEMPERMMPMFQRGDTNHDGKLTADEIRAMAAKQADPQGRAVGRGNAAVNLRTDPITNALDADHDGIFSAAEIAAAPVVLLTLDTDHDGTLSVAELKVRPQTPRERAAHSLDEWDVDRDGFIEKAELPDRVTVPFETLDLNHDGKLDLDELTAYVASQPQGRGPGGPGAQNGAPRPPAPPAVEPR